VYVWGGWRKKNKLGREAKRVKGLATCLRRETKGKGKERDDEKIECVSSDRNGTGTMKEERKREGGTTSGVVCCFGFVTFQAPHIEKEKEERLWLLLL